MRRTPLESWVGGIAGDDLGRWQLEQLNRTLALARTRPWHRARLPEKVASLRELASLPTMSARDLRGAGMGLCCVSPRDIARIVTLRTSGSTGAPKRVCSSAADQQNTVDYFRCGLSTLVRPGDGMAVLFDSARPGGLGSLIARALEELGARPLPWGPVRSLETAGAMLARSGAQTLVGTPVPVLALARYCKAAALSTRVGAVLLSGDYVPRAVRRCLEQLWGCAVYEHYGMTEMGLGGAVDCDAHRGLHIRENDLLVEVVDRDGRPVPDGAWGEVVFTTLTREAMPLVRYRTGDISRVVPGRCPCGSRLRRLAPPAGRTEGGVTLANGAPLWLPHWDEALLGVEGISDFRLAPLPDKTRVTLEVETQTAFSPPGEKELRRAVSGLLPDALVELRLVTRPNTLSLHPQGKRTIPPAAGEAIGVPAM